MALRPAALALAVIGLLGFIGASSNADAQQTVDSQIPGQLIGVGPDQRTLIVEWNNNDVQGCGTPVVTPTVVETAASVSVTLTAVDDALAPGTSCGGVGLVGTVTATLAAPLAGRTIEGLQIQGGAFDQFRTRTETMPDLVGLSPVDARLMLSLPPGVPKGQLFNDGPVGLVDHYVRQSHAGVLASVIAQQPKPGKPMRRGMIVILRVAR